MNYNVRLTEFIEFLLEPIQRQQNIILSLTSWMSGVQLIGNTFSESLIPQTKYLANIVSSKGAFEWYLNNEFNLPNYVPYQPIFIGTLLQSGSNLYGYNNAEEAEYVPLYFIQDSLTQNLNLQNIFLYSNNATYTVNEICYVLISINPIVQQFFQNSSNSLIPINTPPYQTGLFLNTDVWQACVYGFNNLSSTGLSEDVDFIVWVPIYLNPSYPNVNNSEFDIKIRAFLNKYKMAHTTYGINYY